MWHHYTRPLLEVIELDASAPGHVRTTVPDKRMDAPFFNQLRHVVKAGTWFGDRVQGGVVGDASAAAPAVAGYSQPWF